MTIIHHMIQLHLLMNVETLFRDSNVVIVTTNINTATWCNHVTLLAWDWIKKNYIDKIPIKKEELIYFSFQINSTYAWNTTVSKNTGSCTSCCSSLLVHPVHTTLGCWGWQQAYVIPFEAWDSSRQADSVVFCVVPDETHHSFCLLQSKAPCVVLSATCPSAWSREALTLIMLVQPSQQVLANAVDTKDKIVGYGTQ